MVEGSQYPIPYRNVVASTIVSMLRNGVIILALGGDTLFNALTTTPYGTNPIVQQAFALYKTHLAPNRIGWMAGAWMVGNMIGNSLMSTGAFEIYANGVLVFSKLSTGRLPTADEFWGGLDQALRPQS